MAKFRKKPVIIEAVQWTGENREEMEQFIPNTIIVRKNKEGELGIGTLDGVMTASKGDFIIKGVHGEYYPCKPDIFEQTYEPVVEEE